MLSYNIFPPEVEVIGTALFVLIWGCIILFSMRIFRWATLLFLRFFATSFESHFHQDCCRFFFLKKRIIIKNIIVWSVQGMLGSGTKSRWRTWYQNWQYESTDVKSMKLWDAGSRPITNPHIVDRGSCRLVTPGWSMSSLIIRANWSIFHAPDWSFRN